MSTTLTQLTNIGESTKFTATSGNGAGLIQSAASLSTPSSNPTIGNASTGVAGQFDRPFSYTGSVTAGTPYTINFNTGNDQLNNTMNMVHVGRIHVSHQGSTGRITVGGGTHPVMGSDQAVLQPGGSCVFANHGVGYTVAGSSVSGVDPVEALPFNDSSGSGTFNISYMGIITSAITYSSTAATLVGNINTAFNTSFGSGNIVASGSTLAGIIFTGTAGNYQYNAFGGHFVGAIVSGSGFTIGGGTKGTSTTTTAGVLAISGEQDTLTITADCGVVPFTVLALGRSA